MCDTKSFLRFHARDWSHDFLNIYRKHNRHLCQEGWYRIIFLLHMKCFMDWELIRPAKINIWQSRRIWVRRMIEWSGILFRLLYKKNGFRSLLGEIDHRVYIICSISYFIKWSTARSYNIHTEAYVRGIPYLHIYSSCVQSHWLQTLKRLNEKNN